MRTTMVASCALLACGSVFAQSSVTLYGVLDQGLDFTKSGTSSTTKMQDGGSAPSRIGFKGSESLGGGLAVNFVLEAGVNVGTGAGAAPPSPGIEFGRQAFVGLSGPWGRVDAGRMYVPMFYAMQPSDPFHENGVFSPLLLITQTDGQTGFATPYNFRQNNIIQYRSLPSNHLVLGMAYSFGGVPSPDQSSGNSYGGDIGWNQGPFYGVYSFYKFNSGSAAAPVASPATSTYQGLSAHYDISDTMRLSGNYIRASSDPISGSAAVPVATLLNLGASWTYGLSSFEAGATRRTVADSARGQLVWVLGYDYHLSKRTSLYVRVLRLDNRGGASATIAGVPVIANSGNGVSSTDFGISHKF